MTTTDQVEARLRSARTCYDHLAGRVGVALLDSLERSGVVAVDGSAYRVTTDGERWLSRFGVDVASLSKGRRPLARPCPDWTEGRPHLAGALGAALTARLFELGWIERAARGRGVSITVAGREGFATLRAHPHGRRRQFPPRT